MRPRLCSLAHTVHLVLPLERLQESAQENPEFVPSTWNGLKAELSALADLGVPAFFDSRRDDDQITFCTASYELVCGLTPQEDAYRVRRVSPLSLRSHNQIARCVVVVQPLAWQFHGDVRDLNLEAQRTGRPLQSGFEAIRAAWEAAERAAGAPDVRKVRLPPAHLDFLTDVETLIDLAREVEEERTARHPSTPVVGPPVPVAWARVVGDVYRFALASASTFKVGDYVSASPGEPGTRQAGYAGEVIEVTGEAITVHFRKPVDLRVLRQVEWLKPWTSTRQYDIQKAALAALHDDPACAHLLDLIVDGQFEPYDLPDVPAEWHGLNAAQRSMVACAACVPDMLLALGPPGTGKTRTIREIVTQHAQARKRVLITSKNNKAVDNVLEGLEGVDALRIGREQAVSTAVKELMIDARATNLQAEVLGGTEALMASLDAMEALWPQVEDALDRLVALARDWELDERMRASRLQALFRWQREQYKAVARVITSLGRRVARERDRMQAAWARANRLGERIDAAARYRAWPVLGSVQVLRAVRWERQWDEAAREFEDARQAAVGAARNVRRTWDAYRHYVTASTAALAHKREVVEAERAIDAQRARAADGLDHVAGLVGRVSGAPVVGQVIDSPDALAGVRNYVLEWHASAAVRRSLLHEWRTLLETRRQALYPTLIEMADVIGATCIGIATDARFEELAFDLVIADEAGQIQVMDLLVPLVRAERAVLVGDHLQLPPMVDDEVQARVDPDEDGQHTWLEQSLFEHLFARDSTPGTHTAMLDTQYRMPPEIAEFVSGQFYGGKYKTGEPRRAMRYTDPFFQSHVVFVDTWQERDRRERAVREAEGIRGYSNERESRAIADVVLAYEARGAEWGVIVPYKRQAELIRRELRRRRRAFEVSFLNDWVATVDSFQGKERDVIVYGFTRSNRYGGVGFMAELRRLNVSLTRARRQLVMVGDSSTLTRAVDVPFRELICALLDAVRRLPGGMLDVRELDRRLG